MRMCPLRNDCDGTEFNLKLDAAGRQLEGRLFLPENAVGIVVFVHAPGRCWHSPRQLFLANRLNAAGLGTLLFHLFSLEEEMSAAGLSSPCGQRLLCDRLVAATNWLRKCRETSKLPVGYLGWGIGASVAIEAAGYLPDAVKAVVGCSARFDLTEPPKGEAPTLMIVGEKDAVGIDINRRFLKKSHAQEKMFEIVAGASTLFEEPGGLAYIAESALAWFTIHLDQTLVLPDEMMPKRQRQNLAAKL
ncbi:MAG TPA: dienelactone hydrolase family protein [Oculatellaceae cyanobacterium]